MKKIAKKERNHLQLLELENHFKQSIEKLERKFPNEQTPNKNTVFEGHQQANGGIQFDTEELMEMFGSSSPIQLVYNDDEKDGNKAFWTFFNGLMAAVESY